ncbi:MAG: lactonase family protein [Verrucomicrobiota bacterium]
MKVFRNYLFVMLMISGTLFDNALAQPKGETLVYFGTYTRGPSQGIYVSRFDLKTGKFSAPEVAAETKNPSFLAIHPNGQFLYSIAENAGDSNGMVSAFAIEKGGALKLLNQESVGGKGPAHLVVDKKGKALLVANYGGGSVAALPVLDNGKLGALTAFIQHAGSSVNPQRQKEPHAHSINVDAANRFAFVADLGLDKIMVYKFDAAKATLVANEPAFATVPAGGGPRHLAFHPNEKFAYVINEMTCTVTAFSYYANLGELKELQTISALPNGAQPEAGMSGAEIQVHPSGKFVYASIRGHDTIAIFAVEKKTGKLTHIGNEPTQGKVPRNFAIDPTGKFLLAANQNSDSVVIFQIDEQTGSLKATGQILQIPSPVCVKFVQK